MYQNQKIGKLGEKLAAQYLESKGYEILERNFYCRQGEIDRIAKEKTKIIFIEVKSRTSVKYGKPIEAVTKEKQRHLLKAAQYYLYKKHMENSLTRVDGVEVYIKNNKCRINHIKQIIG